VVFGEEHHIFGFEVAMDDINVLLAQRLQVLRIIGD
jgi:hypothetical protein